MLHICVLHICATLIHTCTVTIGLDGEDTLCMFGIWHSVVCIWGKFGYLGVCIWYIFGCLDGHGVWNLGVCI